MFNITRQAYLYMIVALITSVINLILSGILFGISGFFGYIIVFLMVVPFLLLAIYNIDCLSTGSCDIWAWINSILGMLYMIMTTILMITVSVIAPKEKEEDKK